MDRKTDRVQRILTALISLLCFLITVVFLILNADLLTQKKANVQTIRFLKEEIQRTEEEISATEKQIISVQSRTEEIQAENMTFIHAREQYFLNAMELERRVLNDETDLKIAYLTFDDGPYEATTGRFLDVLDEYHILATFFMLGKTTEIHDALYHRIYESGHTIANHTYSHQIRNGIYRSSDAFMEDVLKNRSFIYDKLGITTNILRFPGGSETAGDLKEEIIERLRQEGYGYVDWNAETLDGKYIDLSAQEYRDNLFERVNDQKLLVVLMHDYCEGTLEALPEIIEGLQERGYIFLPLFYESAAVNR